LLRRISKVENVIMIFFFVSNITVCLDIIFRTGVVLKKIYNLGDMGKGGITGNKNENSDIYKIDHMDRTAGPARILSSVNAVLLDVIVT